MKNIFIISTLVFTINQTIAQDSARSKPLTFSGYLEAYYCYDISNPANHERPPFFYSFNKHNEVNLNIGFAKAAYSSENTRANFALMVGSYAQYNLAAEQQMLRTIFEANAGFKLSKNKNLWLDAGVMPSHIGFESAIGKDCWNLTRSILADNSPYYEAGVKINYTAKNEKLYLAAMYLNGWQRIQRIPGNQTPAFGTQLTYKPNSKTTLNWSTFFGNDFPDNLRQYRIFNNLYTQVQINEKVGVIAGFDYGIQQVKKDDGAYNNWYSPVAIIQIKPTKKIRVAARAEYYSDEKGVIISTGTANGFQTFGYSLNLDYVIAHNILWRIEGRSLNSKDKIFRMNHKLSSANHFFTSSLAVSF